MHVCMCACEHVCMCACVHVSMCACVHVCMGGENSLFIPRNKAKVSCEGLHCCHSSPAV